MKVDRHWKGADVVRCSPTKSPARASTKGWKLCWAPSDRLQRAILEAHQEAISTGEREQTSEVELPVVAARRENDGRKHEPHPKTWRVVCGMCLAASAVPMAARWDIKMRKLSTDMRDVEKILRTVD